MVSTLVLAGNKTILIMQNKKRNNIMPKTEYFSTNFLRSNFDSVKTTEIINIKIFFFLN